MERVQRVMKGALPRFWTRFQISRSLVRRWLVREVLGGSFFMVKLDGTRVWLG